MTAARAGDSPSDNGHQGDHALADRFERDLEDVESLCADRQLVTSEIFNLNDVYGGASVLKRHAGIPLTTSLRAIVPHGVYGDLVHDWELEGRLPAAFVFPRYRMAAYRERGIVPIAMAAPFVYANQMVTSDAPRRGTLFFPSHSTHGLTVEMDFDNIAARLLELPDWMKPVSVMGYWRDVQLGHHRVFTRRGFRVVSAGHIYDPDFLLRLAYLLRRHRHAASTALGSSVFYSVWSGCSFHILSEPHRYAGTERALREEHGGESTDLAKTWREVEKLFSSWTPDATDEQRGLAREYVGGDAIWEPGQFVDLHAWLRRLDRFGRASTLVDGAALDLPWRAGWVPYVLPRTVAAAVRNARRLGRRIRPLRSAWHAVRARRRP